MADDRELNRYRIIHASSRKVDKSAKLWRYLAFEKFIWLLEKSILWHTRLDCLGDPFEGSMPSSYVKSRDATELPEYLQTGQPREVERHINMTHQYARFATCWHASPSESAVMWKLYSSEHAGVAITSTQLRMRESVDLAPYGSGYISPVEYLDFETDDLIIPGSPCQVLPGLFKRRSFAHENEVRGLIVWSDHSKMPNPITLDKLPELTKMANPKGIGVKVDLRGLIEEIYINPLAPSFVKDVVLASADRHGLADRIRLSKLGGEPVW